jgi:hypothetical protein
LDEPSVTFDLFLECKIFVQIYQRGNVWSDVLLLQLVIKNPIFALKCDDHPLKWEWQRLGRLESI